MKSTRKGNCHMNIKYEMWLTYNAEKEKICEINFELVIQKIQSSHSFKEISKQHTKLIEECDKIIEDLKSGIKFKTL